jgi:hypothetical protein
MIGISQRGQRIRGADDPKKRVTTILRKNNRIGYEQVSRAKSKTYGGRGFFMIPFNSRPIRRHLFVIVLMAPLAYFPT